MLAWRDAVVMYLIQCRDDHKILSCAYLGVQGPSGIPCHPRDLQTCFIMKFLLSVVITALALAHSVVAFSPPPIPLNWTTVYACAVDVPSRVIAHDVTTQYSDNTPASCIERCDAGNYVYAGVEYSNECHCGTALSGATAAAPVTDCNMACTGDPTLSCGGSWRIQVRRHLRIFAMIMIN